MNTSILSTKGYAWFIGVITVAFIAVTVTGILLAQAPATGQTPIHQWLGLALSGGMIVHLLLHKSWLSKMFLKKPKDLTRKTKINRVLAVILTLLVILLIVSGIGLGGLFGEEISKGTVWQKMHHLTGKLMAIIGIWHILRHRNWIFRKIKPQ